MGLGNVNENRATYLSIAGGFIWNRKADENDINYAIQEFDRKDGTKGSRSGARYSDLTGRITGVVFKTHPEYGESINVSFNADDERYVVSVSTNNRFSQDIMKFLLKADLSKDTFMKPFDFIGKDKKRVQGISFRQEGEKINLFNEDAPDVAKDFFKVSSKKIIKRYFEDLNDWYIAEVEEKVCPKFTEKATISKTNLDTNVEEKDEEREVEKEKESKSKDSKNTIKPTKMEEKKITPLQMKKAIKAYIAENYEGKKLPQIKGDELKKWYNLTLALEELPFDDDENDLKKAEEGDDLEDQLNSLIED